MRAYLPLLLSLFLVGPAVAQPEPPAASAASSEADADRRVAALAEELKSPFCPGKTLQTCTSYQAYQLRKEMHEMVQQGLTDTQIIAELKIRYGDDVQNPPQPWYTFFVPLLPYVLGGILVLLVVRHWLRRGKADAPPPAPAVGSEDAERLARLRARVAASDDE